ncbi:hypothetical protein BOW14_12860, partial [Solemya velum gill symbiont]|uniref:hypothetical protein n=1 Tax=Solemya velum gill symbiont TaxID=2340 RepID=UPI0009D00C4F
TGPFDIIQKLSDVNYVISQPDSRKKQVVHFNRLKPCFLREQSGDTSIDKSLNGNLSADMGESVETDVHVLPEYEMENVTDFGVDVTDEIMFGGPGAASPQETRGRKRKPPEWMRSGMYDLT